MMKACLQAAGLTRGPCTALDPGLQYLQLALNSACNLTQPTFSCAPGTRFLPLRLNMSAPAAIKARQPCKTAAHQRLGELGALHNNRGEK